MLCAALTSSGTDPGLLCGREFYCWLPGFGTERLKLAVLLTAGSCDWQHAVAAGWHRGGGGDRGKDAGVDCTAFTMHGLGPHISL